MNEDTVFEGSRPFLFNAAETVKTKSWKLKPQEHKIVSYHDYDVIKKKHEHETWDSGKHASCFSTAS